MAPVTTELKVLVKVAGDKGLDKLSRSLINIGKQAQASSVNFDQVAKRLQQVQRNSNNSISSLRNYRNAWRDIADQVQIGSKTFKQATAEAKRLDAQLQRAQGRRTGGGGALGRGAQVAGTVAAAGVFGGAEGALGAGIGAVFGGPAGAAVGGAIGGQVGQLRQALGATSEYAAELRKLRIALFGVTTSQQEFGDALEFVAETTKTFSITQDVVTRQFTRLQASVQGAGGDLEDTKIAFNGIVAAVRATGGSLADVDAALTATAQVFSKGKVSAEELRQQIGERLPGAFTLFAEAIDKTPQELDKALEKGEVSLQDFQTFAEALFKRYGETAQEIAKGPESAGDRLEVALQELNEAVGTLLQPIGAAFQETFASIATAIAAASKALAYFFGIGDEAIIEKNTILIQATNKSIRDIKGTIKEMERTRGGVASGFQQGLIDEQKRTLKELEAKRETLRAEINRATRAQAPDVPQAAPSTGLPGIVPSAPKDRGGAAAERKQEKAIEKAIALQIKLERTIRDTAFSLERVGETARQAIQNKYALALQVAIDKEEDLKRTIDELERDAGQKFPQLTSLATELAVAFEDIAAKERDFALFNLRLDELGLKLENFQELARQAFDPAGAADADLSFNIGTDVFERQAEAIDKLLEKYPQLGEVANATAELMTSGFRDVIEGAQSAREVFANFLRSIADTLLQSAQQMIAQFISIGIARMFAFGGSGFNLGANFGGFGGGASSALGGLSFTDLGGFQFASGGVFAKNKIVPFANGGIVKKPTVFPFANGIGLMGEAGPEAIMPLRRTSSGRLGVEATGGTNNIVVNVDASGTQVQGDDTRGKQLGGAISAAVQAELIKQRRPGGLLAS